MTIAIGLQVAGIEGIVSGEQQGALETIRQSIRDRRVESGWTQQQLAAKSGVSRPTIARLESGQPVSSSTLAKLAAALGLQLCVTPIPPHANGVSFGN